MKRRIVVGVTALSLVALLLSGCGGVPQEDLDAAEAARDAAQAQVSSLKSDLSAAKSDLSAAEAEAASLQEDLAAAESDLASAQSAKSSAESAKSAAQSELSAVKSDLAAAEAKIAELEAAAAAAPAEEEVAEEEVAEEEVAEEEVAEEEVAEEEPAAELSFSAAVFDDAEHGFSISYPDDWAQDDAGMEDEDTYFAAKGGMGLPGLSVSLNDKGDMGYQEASVASSEEGGEVTDIEIVTEEFETTLADGTPAFAYVSKWKLLGYDFTSYNLGVKVGDNWLVVVVWTIEMYWPYDDLPAEEIARTLTLK